MVQTPPQKDPRLHYNIEQADMEANWINLRGWVFHEVEQVSGVRLVIQQKITKEQHRPQFNIERRDVGNAFPDYENAFGSGFSGRFQVGLTGEVEIFLELTLGNKENVTVFVKDVLVGRAGLRNSFLKFIQSITWLRILKAFRFLIRGDFSGLKAKFAYVQDQNTRYTLKYSRLKSLLPAFQAKPLEPIILHKEIDIIIPVYNGYEFLGPLFNSILKNTCTPYRLIIIDDRSTDERVYPFLEKVAGEHGHTVLLRHDENQGFIHSVNRAFQEVKNHFVILNTDVEVPYNWLGRLMRPIMGSHNIATTTPFSNSASICSFPHFCRDNEIFEGLPVGVIDKVFATLTDMAPVDIPTGVGFCMGVNLHVAKKIGLFDPIFGKGYGEENDLCMRATALSYGNVMVPNLFVYHKHGGSFATAEKQKLLKRNLEILCERHTTYESLVKEFIDKDPLRPLRELFMVMVSCNCLGKKIRLLIDHDIGGGANQYRNRLIGNYIADKEPVLLLTFDRDGDSFLKLKFYYKDYVLNFILDELSELKDLARLIRISEIFYNNAVTYPNPISVAELISELKDLTGAHLTVSWHDFFPICPSYTLLNDKGRFCDIPDFKVCASCLKNHEDKDIRKFDMPHWRKVWGGVIEKSDTLLCFSENTAALVKKAYGGCDEKIEVHPHRLYNFSSKIPGLDFSEGLHVGILGNINYQKGLSNIFDLAMEIERTQSKTRLTVIGNIDAASCHSNITVTGTYNPSELPEIIEKRKINVFLFPSIWPETFSYVTEEIMAMKMPVVCYNLGAPADRVKKYELGRILGSMKADDILRELQEFYENLPSLALKHR